MCLCFLPVYSSQLFGENDWETVIRGNKNKNDIKSNEKSAVKNKYPTSWVNKK